MSYFTPSWRDSQSDRRPILENAGPAARLEKWWRRACAAAWRDNLAKLRQLSYEVASDPRTLVQSFSYLRAHGGAAPGPDGVTYDDLIGCGLWDVCRNVSASIRSGHYAIEPPRLVPIEKPRQRGRRWISLFNVVDRVVSRAVAATLTPLLAPGLTDAAYGGLPGRGPAAAFARVFRELSAADRPLWVTADVRAAFDTVPRCRLLDLFAHFPRPIVELLAQLAHTHRRRGFAQGLPSSPLLMHVYLDHFIDRPFRRKFPQTPLLRYLDDHLILCRSQRVADLAAKHLDRLVRDCGLKLKQNPPIADIRTEAAQWLGMSLRQGDRHLIDGHILEDAWTSLADRLRRCQIEGRDAQAVVTGWLSYHSIAYRGSAASDIVRRARRLCKSFGVEPPPAKVLAEQWRDSWVGIVERAGGAVLRVS